MATATGWLLRVGAAAALAVVAGVHIHLADGYSLLGDRVTQGDLFRVQAAVAAVVALALLVRVSRSIWLAAAAVGLASLLAVVVTVYVPVPALGPLPRVFEPIWYGEKVAAAVAAGTALAAAAAGLRLALPPGRGGRPAVSSANPVAQETRGR